VTDVRLQGRVALVTGAGRRLGRAIAEAIGAQGARVAVHYNHSEDEAAQTKRVIESVGGEATLFGADLTDANAPRQLVDAVVGHFGALDILVNSAAIMERTPIGEVTVESWNAMFALNLRAPFFLVQAAAPHLRTARAGGAVVNIADLAAFEAWPAYVPHGITKAGVVQMTRALARARAGDSRERGGAGGGPAAGRMGCRVRRAPAEHHAAQAARHARGYYQRRALSPRIRLHHRRDADRRRRTAHPITGA
jgi:pteridine reductase